jgi:prephenate dehydrogenase
MAVMFNKMVVAGVGLIGGSLALDMRRLGLVKEIMGAASRTFGLLEKKE